MEANCLSDSSADSHVRRIGLMSFLPLYIALLLCGCGGDNPTHPKTQPNSSTDVLNVITQAAQRRIDLIFIGDSNTALGGYGWDHGIQRALVQHYNMYATGMITAKENQGNGAGLGYLYNYGNNLPEAASSGAPADLDSYLSGVSIQNYGYVENDTSQSGMALYLQYSPSEPHYALNMNHALRFHFAYGTFDTGSGSFTPGIRVESPPYTTLISGSAISTNSGNRNIVFTAMDIPEGYRDSTIAARFSHIGQTIYAPFIGYYIRCEDPSLLTGFSFTTWYGSGGQSLYDMAHAVINAPDNTVWTVLNEARHLQEYVGQEPVVIMVVNSGLNDRGETSSPSLGPVQSTNPDSAQAYVDNLQALVDRVEAVWHEHWSDGQILWLIIPSHTISDPDDSELMSYRQASKAFAANRANMQVIDMTEIFTYQEAMQNGWYNAGGTDPVHLTQAGYEAIAGRLFP